LKIKTFKSFYAEELFKMASLIKLKIMPSSVEEDLEKIREKVKESVEEYGGRNVRFEEEPIAFGLKAVITIFVLEEEGKEIEPLEENLRGMEGVSSVELLDIRKAIG